MRRHPILVLASFLLFLHFQSFQIGTAQAQAGSDVLFGNNGYTDYGEWRALASVSPAFWQPGKPLTIHTVLLFTESHLASLAAVGIKPDGFCVLVTAERTFDSEGWIRLPSDEKMSTLLTPTGLPIEGGVQGAVTNRYGYGFRTPVDLFQTGSLKSVRSVTPSTQGGLTFRTTLPSDLPPGIYRIRLDYGLTVGKRLYSLNGENFATRPFFKSQPTHSHLYSPPLRADGKHVSGRLVDSTLIQPKIPWVLLSNYNSNGYRGVVADEDRGRFGISGRNLIQDDVILPLYDDNNNRISYSLEPQFPTDTIELRSNIPWNYTAGELSVKVTGPDGKTTDLGTSPFVGNSGQWPTTRRSTITAWKPAAYGLHVVELKGYTVDIWGNRYEGGGTYRFWIAKRMTLATATFQGMAYPVGNRYGRDIGFAPAVPAWIEVTATLYPYSDPARATTVKYNGNASSAGVFTAAQGLAPLPFTAPGEYKGQVLAQYRDPDGHLWVCSMTHAGVVYPEDSPITARGKKLTIGGKYVDRGETKFEGWVDKTTNTNYLAHINFPYQQGDVLLIASEQQGANKIEPVLLYETKAKPETYNSVWQSIGRTNVQLKTSNGYSPHLFPEYITDWAYYYAGAPRPGFMSRFLVAEDGTRAPYWPTSPNSFGGQINASYNGDLPGDIYRLIGGVVLRKKGEIPAYAGYLASAFLLPKGSNNNRVIAPGTENVRGPAGMSGRFFLVGTRPGMMYETGSQFGPAVQIDPVLPIDIYCTLTYPDGRLKEWAGKGDAFGSFAAAAADRALLDVPGVYRFRIEGSWNGFKGYMPGMPATGGDIYVIEKERPAGANSLKLNLGSQTVFNAAMGTTISGTSTASKVRFAAIIPGAVLDQGELEVRGGKFEYFLDPGFFNTVTPTYDNANLVSGKPELGDVVHLTFFSKEVTGDGTPYHSFVRLIIRGNRIMYAR